MSGNASFSAQPAQAQMKDIQGKSLDSVSLKQTPSGVLVTTDLERIPTGWHGFHVHAIGSCEPTFKSAGGQFNPDGQEHGLANENGRHAGDMPNLYSVDNGVVKVEVFNTGISLQTSGNGVFDGDGSSIIIHAKADVHGKNPVPEPELPVV